MNVGETRTGIANWDGELRGCKGRYMESETKTKSHFMVI